MSCRPMNVDNTLANQGLGLHWGILAQSSSKLFNKLIAFSSQLIYLKCFPIDFRQLSFERTVYHSTEPFNDLLMFSFKAMSDLSLFWIFFYQLADDYKKLNPMGQVPALIIDGHTLADSVSNWFYFVTLLLTQTINGIQS